MPSFLRSPLLHFLLLGASIFAAQGFRASHEEGSPPEAHRITLDTQRLAELQQGFVDQAGRRPDAGEIERMIEAEVDEEILYREAIARGLLERDGGVQTRLIQKMLFLEGATQIEDAGALLARATRLGLHHEDVVVRRILVEKMKLLGSMLDADERVRPEEVSAAYQARGEALRAPDRLSLVHVFLSRDRRGETLEAEARALRERLVATEMSPAEAVAWGDPFPLGHRLEDRSLPDLERSFGGHVGEAAFALPLGVWSEPVESAYGLHLVHVDARAPGRIPPLEAVGERLRLALEEQRRAAKLEALQTDLRARYEVVLPEQTPPPLVESRDHGPREETQEPG
jgi:hypothetical protein